MENSPFYFGFFALMLFAYFSDEAQKSHDRFWHTYNHNVSYPVTFALGS